MEYIIGILLIISFIGLVVYAVKGGNLLLGMIIMGTIWSMLSLVGNNLVTNPAFIAQYSDAMEKALPAVLSRVYQKGPEGWGVVIVNFIFGAWFARIMMDLEIVSTIIRKTVEFGGDRPAVTTILLSIVTAAISTSMFGTGAVVCIGVIVLPITLSLGVRKDVAVCTFMTSVGAGLFLNPLIFNQYQAFFLDSNQNPTYFFDSNYQRWGLIALVTALVISAFVIIITSVQPENKYRKRRRVKTHSWAAAAGANTVMNAPGIALLTPFLPVIIIIGLGWPVIASFLVSGLFALIACKKITSFRELGRIMNRTFYNGVVDMAPLLGFILCIPMFIKASELTVPYFSALLKDVIPQSSLVLCIVFAVLAPLALFRGPFTLAGCGAATLGILKGIGFPAELIFPLFYATTIYMGISCCITQSWVAWGISYTKMGTRDYLKLSIPMGWGFCLIMAAATYVLFG